MIGNGGSRRAGREEWAILNRIGILNQASSLAGAIEEGYTGPLSHQLDGGGTARDSSSHNHNIRQLHLPRLSPYFTTLIPKPEL